ncbi:MAG: transposase [Deltaproteobacteria bacterium]|nr:transposase [Deltaproteobacteria bacterium]
MFPKTARRSSDSGVLSGLSLFIHCLQFVQVKVILVHIMIGNMKTFLNGTFHGVSSNYLQEYLDEFCYRFNRRFWEPELPLRLLNACLAHVPVKIAEFH